MKRNEFLNPNITLLRVLVKSLPWEVLSTLQHSLTSQQAPKQTEGKVLVVPAQPGNDSVANSVRSGVTSQAKHCNEFQRVFAEG